MFTAQFTPRHNPTNDAAPVTLPVSATERQPGGPAESSIRRVHRVAFQSNATAFVFSGGGARGALHVGALRALLEAGIRPDMLIGTSIGAWNAAWLALAPTLEGVERLADIWTNLQAGQVLLGQKPSFWSRKRALKGLLMLTALRRIVTGGSSLYGDSGLRQILARYLAGVRFEDLKLPLSVIATDLSHGGRAIFRHGQIMDAVLASSAIPGIFPPVQIDGSMYADGGMVDGCSIETAIEMGARRIFVLAIAYDAEEDDGAGWAQTDGHEDVSGRGQHKRPAPSVIQRASQVMGNYQIERAMERAPRGVEVNLISLSPGTGGGSLSFGNVAGWIESAYRSTKTYLDTLATRRVQGAGQPAEANAQALTA